ncbi:MAG: methyltransferase [Thermoleophilia bacterium]|nr:methyltransferase [Thermoleophilia bacterium]
MIKYIGSKRTLVPRIVDIVGRIPDVRTACDLFTGTTRVAQGLKRHGIDVTTNDLATYSEVLGTCYVEADLDAVDLPTIEAKLQHLAALPGVDGYVTEAFCEQARYFQPHNGRRIDAIRPEIEQIADGRIERAILLTSLLEAADRVDSTTGLQMAYLKQWAKRSFKDLELRVPELIAGTGTALRRDANELAPELDVDLVYLDPPYNQHSYYSNYHIWETVVRGDAPDTYGIANKRVDCQTNKSDYNSKRRAWDAFTRLVRSLDVPYLLVSFSNEGYFAADDIVQLLGERGEVAVLPVDFKRYVGAQIGIHNPAGVRVGDVGALRNTEYLFLVGAGAQGVLDGVQGDLARELTA